MLFRHFSERTLRSCRGVHPALVAVMLRAIAKFEQLNSDAYVIVVEGIRDQARQDQLRAEGKSWVKTSKHQLGLALDVVVVVKLPLGKRETDFPEAYEDFHDVFAEVAFEMAVPYIWGGNWKVRDYGHFELPHS